MTKHMNRRDLLTSLGAVAVALTTTKATPTATRRRLPQLKGSPAVYLVGERSPELFAPKVQGEFYGR